MDFFDLRELGKAKRKVIYFGDLYQISAIRADELYWLLGEFQKSRELKHQSLKITPIVIDTTDGSAKLANASSLVTAIRRSVRSTWTC